MVPSEAIDIFARLDHLKQPLQAKRTPIPISNTNDEIDFTNLFWEHTQKLREEEEQKKQAEEQRHEEEIIGKALEEEEHRQRMHEQMEAQRQNEV